MPHFRIGEPVKRRAWVLDKNSANLDRAVVARLSGIQARLWRECPDELSPLFFFMLLGVIPLKQALFSIWALAMDYEDEKKRDSIMLRSWHAIIVLSYLDRVGGGEPKIIYFYPPWLLPSGYVHVLDLKPPELDNLLRKALATYGTDKRLDYISKLPTASELSKTHSGPCQKEPVPAKFAEHVEKIKDWLRQTLEHRALIEKRKLTKKDKAQSARIVEQAFATPTIRYLLSHEAEFNEQVEKVMPDVFRQDSELRITQAVRNKDKAVEALGASKLYDKSEHATGSLKKRLKRIYEREWKQLGYKSRAKANKKTTPDIVYRVYHEAYSYVKHLKKHDKKYHNLEASFMDYERKYPGIKREEFKALAQETGTPGEIAIRHTAKRLGITPDYCELLQKEGSKTFHINEAWYKFFTPLLDELKKMKAKDKK